MAINTQTLTITTASAPYVINLRKPSVFLELFNIGPNNVHVNPLGSTAAALADECMLIRPNERIKILPVYNIAAIAEVGNCSLQINTVLY